MTRRLLPLLLLAALAGCETEERTTHRIPGVTGEGVRPTPREQPLLDRIERDPKDVRAWFELGAFHERAGEWTRALAAYDRGQALLAPGKYTSGHLALARVSLRLDRFDRAAAELDAITALEPTDRAAAQKNADFAEAHYLRGALLWVTKDRERARAEFRRFTATGGDSQRVADYLQD